MKSYFDSAISQFSAARSKAAAIIEAVKSNPVLQREVLARWRTNAAFFIVFGYAIVLALLAFFNYIATARTGIVLDNYLRPISFPGRELFIRFNQWQMAAWAVFTPVLTATAIASEREGGQLDSLLLSHLTPDQIVWGKWGATMAFVMLMLLVPLPVGALCFQLGGLSPFEFLLAALLQIGNAALCAAVGLYYSAESQSSDRALGMSLLHSCVWGWFGPVALIPLVFSNPFFGTFILMILLPIYCQLTLVLVSNAAFLSTRPQEAIKPYEHHSWLDKATNWLQTALRICEEFLEELLNPSPNQTWSSSHPNDYRTEAIPMVPPRRVAAPIANQAASTVPLPDLADPERYKRWDMPGAEALRFENPILQREVRRHLRLRAEQVGANSAITKVLVGWFLVPCFVLYGLALLGNAEGHPYFWGLFSTLWLPSAVMGAGVLSAGAFTRERSSRMLDFLWLTSLSKPQVYWGKLASVLVVIGYYSLA